MTIEDFEARYRADPDPWSYESSDYERGKYAATLEACGAEVRLPVRWNSALRSACSRELLAPRCRSLTTVDAAPTAVAIARRRLAGYPHVTVLLGRIPDAIPPAAYDLVIASEILYYLRPGGTRPDARAA